MPDQNDPQPIDSDNILLQKICRRLASLMADMGGDFLHLTGGTLTGPLILAGDPTDPNGAATKNYVDSGDAAERAYADSTFVRIDGASAMTGALNLNTHLIHNVVDPAAAQDAATKNYVDTTTTANPLYVLKAGDLMTGTLGVNNAVAPPIVGIGLNLGAVAANNVLRINGDSTANHAPVLSLFRSGNREWTFAPFNDSLFIGNSTGLADFTDATLQATPNLEITSTGSFKITRGILTANAPSISAKETWNNAGVAFVGWRLTVTDTASAAASDLFQLVLGVTTKFSVRKDGAVTMTGPLNMSTNLINNVTDPVSAQDAATKIYVDSPVDATFRIVDDGDATKKLAFQCSGITAGNTRTLTVPNVSSTIEVISNKDAASGYAGLTAGTKLNLAQMQEVMGLSDLSDVTTVAVTKGNILAASGAAYDDLAVGTDGFVLTADAASSLGIKWATPVTSFADNVFLITDDGDPTKKLAFQVSGVTTATTRTLTVPNVSSTIEVTANKDAASGYAGLTAGTKLNLAQMQEVMGLSDLSDVTTVTATKGDLLVGDGSNFDDLAVGSDNQFLIADSAQSLGVRWGTLEQSVRVYHASAQSIANNTNTVLAFDTERYDNGGLHSGGANTKLTAIVAGRYSISINVGWAGNATGQRVTTIRLNGATTIAAVSTPVNILSNSTYQTITCDYDMAANDYVEIVVAQSSGISLNVESTGNISPEFSMHLIH